MSTKSQIQTGINTINTGGVNTALEVRTLHELELGNTYADIVNETHSSGTITAQTPALNFYDISICKQGRKVTITGKLETNLLFMTSTTSFFEIVNSEYFPASPEYATKKFFGHASNDDRPIRLKFSSNQLMLDESAIGIGTIVYIEIEYLTEN